MTRNPILVFDFDGVIVDGLIEYWNSSREACLQIIDKTQVVKESLPLEIPYTFRKLRPWVKNGWEMVLLVAEHLREDSLLMANPSHFAKNYKDNCHDALNIWGWEPKQLQTALDNVRQQAISTNKEKWLASHIAFSGVAERINQLENEGTDFAVLTTKSASFTSELLNHFNLYPKLLYGHESGKKPNLLLQIAKERLIRGFIEDRRATLETVINTPGLSSIPCYLATWGYLKPQDFHHLPKKINLLRPENLMSPLANWP